MELTAIFGIGTLQLLLIIEKRFNIWHRHTAAIINNREEMQYFVIGTLQLLLITEKRCNIWRRHTAAIINNREEMQYLA